MLDMMKRTGRIWGTVTCLLFLLGWGLYAVCVDGVELWKESMVYIVPIVGIISWWMGLQYDRVKYYAEKYRLQSLELRRSQMKLQTIFNNAGMGIALIDQTGRLMEVNPKFMDMFGYSGQELRTMRIGDISFPEDIPHNMKLLKELMEGKIDSYKLDKRYIRKDGHLFWGKVISTLIPGEGDTPYVLGIVTPITEHKSTEEKLLEQNQVLETLSNLDALTGIGNRRSFEDGLQQEWSKALSHSRPVSLLMVDVDYFKEYNDFYGHQAGDDCLRSVAEALSHQMDGIGCVNRYGGEEFAMIMPNAELDAALGLGERLRTAVESLHIAHGRSLIGPYVTISVGVAALLPTEETNMEELVLQADKALYQAKKEGRNRVKAA